jgi:hypothetical protein
MAYKGKDGDNRLGNNTWSKTTAPWVRFLNLGSTSNFAFAFL